MNSAIMRDPCFLLVIIFITQIMAALFFKYGSRWRSGSRQFLYFFLAGNTVGATSMIFAMKYYGIMEDNPNLAGTIIGGGTFIATQLVFAILFRKDLNWKKVAGVIIAAVGLFLATFYAPEDTGADAPEKSSAEISAE